MHHFDLDQYLSGHVYAFLFIFSRIGTAMMLMPGIGESHVPQRTRLFLALAMSFILVPVMLPRLPALPADMSKLVTLIAFEVIVGLFFGTLLRLVMDTLETAGSIVALQMGLSNATVFNPTLSSQSPLPSALYSVVGGVLIFITGIDHMLLHGITSTYDIFPPGGAFEPGDMADMVGKTMGQCFSVGIQLAMPFVAIGLLLFLALGMIQKLMPMLQLFTISTPAQIWGGIFLLGATMSGVMTAWLHFLNSSIGTFFGG